MENKTLTPTHWELYRLIKERSLNGLKTTVKDICEKINYFVLHESESNKSNCPSLYEFVDDLNNSYQIEKIIIKDNNNFHLGTEEECAQYAKKLKIRALKMWAKYRDVLLKIKDDGNGKLVSCENKANDLASSCRDFVESYIKRFKDGD